MLIVIEGMDGTGKSTQVQRLSQLLAQEGHEVVMPREPGGTVIGEQIREILLNNNMTDMAELLLFNAARVELDETVIRPAIQGGQTVLMDRWAWSTLAYQHHPLCSFFMEEIIKTLRYPDLTLVLDMFEDDALARSGKTDRIEKRGKEYFETVRIKYQLLSDHWRQVHLINADQPIEKVTADCWAKIKKLIEIKSQQKI